MTAPSQPPASTSGPLTGSPCDCASSATSPGCDACPIRSLAAPHEGEPDTGSGADRRTGPAAHPEHRTPDGRQADSHEHHRDKHSGHDHGVSADADTRYLWTAFGLLAAFLVIEVVIAWLSGSVALLADAGHMLSDVGALAGSLWAISLARRPATDRWTFGLKRAEVLSAAVNGITLLVVGALVTVESVDRLIHPPDDLGGTPLLVTALIGVAVNVAATLVLARANRSSLNVEGAFQHILTDLYAFIGTVIAGLIIITTGFVRADAIASLVVVGLMFLAAWRLLRESGRVLLEAAPRDVSLRRVREHLLELDEVVAVHDLHAWTVTSDLQALSAHVVIRDECFSDGRCPAVLEELQRCLSGHFDLAHSTFQLEPATHPTHENALHP